jgi:hypothetical protein
MPCHGGYRHQLELSMERQRQERETEQSPERQYWYALVARSCNDDSLSLLVHEERLYFAVQLLSNEVHRGGFHTYFFNSSGGFYRYAIEGLLGLGAKDALQSTTSAKKRVFGNTPVPTDTGVRRTYLNEHNTIDIDLDDLENIFCDHAKDLDEKCRWFAREHGFFT